MIHSTDNEKDSYGSIFRAFQTPLKIDTLRLASVAAPFSILTSNKFEPTCQSTGKYVEIRRTAIQGASIATSSAESTTEKDSYHCPPY